MILLYYKFKLISFYKKHHDIMRINASPNINVENFEIDPDSYQTGKKKSY